MFLIFVRIYRVSLTVFGWTISGWYGLELLQPESGGQQPCIRKQPGCFCSTN